MMLYSGMHGRGSKGAAPASDSAGRGDAGGTPLTTRPCRVLPRGFPDSRRRGSNRAVSAEYRCVSAGKRKSAGKKKKKFKTENTGGFDTQSSPA